MAKTSSDPYRVKAQELIQEMADHLQSLRDYALTPGSAWLAKNELEAMSRLMNDLEQAIQDLRQNETA